MQSNEFKSHNVLNGSAILKSGLLKPGLLFNLVGVLIILLSLNACTLSKPNQKTLREQAAASGLVENRQHQIDLSFSSPNKSLKNYSTIYFEPLNLADVKIIRSSSRTIFDTPWELNNDDRAYYQEKYMAAANRNLIESNLFKSASTAADADLILKAKIIEIAPLASKDDMKGRPTMTKVYSEGFGTMTIVLEFYDAKTNALVAAQMDQHDLGTLWEENNRVQNNREIKVAFDYWFSAVKDLLKAQTKS